MNVCGGLISENVSYNAIFLIVFEYSIKQKAPTIVRLLMLINDVFLCLILEHQCCSSLECVGTVTIAHS